MRSRLRVGTHSWRRLDGQQVLASISGPSYRCQAPVKLAVDIAHGVGLVSLMWRGHWQHTRWEFTRSPLCGVKWWAIQPVTDHGCRWPMDRFSIMLSCRRRAAGEHSHSLRKGRMSKVVKSFDLAPQRCSTTAWRWNSSRWLLWACYESLQISWALREEGSPLLWSITCPTNIWFRVQCRKLLCNAIFLSKHSR